MKRFVALLLLSFSALFLVNCTASGAPAKQAKPASQQTVKVIGAATVFPLLQALAAKFEGTAQGIKIVFLPASHTAGGITGVRDELVDIGTVTRAPKPDEQDDHVRYRELAKDGLLVATNASVKGIADVKTEELRKVYSGALRNWRELGGSDGEIVVLDRPEDESAKILLREQYLGKDLKIAPTAILLQQEPELISTMRDTPNSIGAFSLAYAMVNNLPFNRLSLDGVTPTVENISAGRYKMVRSLGIVWRTTPSEATKEFVDFIFSEAGLTVMRQAGVAPSTQSK